MANTGSQQVLLLLVPFPVPSHLQLPLGKPSLLQEDATAHNNANPVSTRDCSLEPAESALWPEQKPACSSDSHFSTVSRGRACANPPPSAVGAQQQMLPKCSFIKGGFRPRTPPGLGQKESRHQGSRAGELPSSEPRASSRGLKCKHCPESKQSSAGRCSERAFPGRMPGPAPPAEAAEPPQPGRARPCTSRRGLPSPRSRLALLPQSGPN